MNFTLSILGTASAMPISDRNPSAQVLSVHGRLFLIDCAEGTQQQIRRMHLSFLKIEAIFLSHIHGDHCFGIFGLLSTMAMYGRTQELHIYAPAAFAGMLKCFRTYFSDGVNFEIVHHVLSGKGLSEIHLSKAVRVCSFPLDHKIECYGFRFDEVLSARGKASGHTPASYAYCSDTRPFEELPGFVKGVSLLYHEATYPLDMEDKAAARFHSTTADAARCALQASAGRLLVGHYSSRVTDFDALLAECRSIFPATDLAQDLMTVEI